MSASEADALADVVVSTMQRALTPILADVKVLQSQIASWEARWCDIGTLRERIAVIESKSGLVSGEAVELRTDGFAEITDVRKRLEQLEARALVPGPVGAAGRDGVDGKDGRDGIDGKDGTVGPQGERGAAGERGEKGEPGTNGLDGAIGLPGPAGERGPQGERGERGEPGLTGERGLHGADGQAGRDGQPGVPGRDGQPGEKGLDGSAGRDGKDGRDGVDGKDGRDGVVTLEAVTLEQIDERQARFVRADGTPIPGVLKFAVPLDRGVYVQGKTYEKGDSVSFGGSLWIAQRDTEAIEKPGDGSPAWRLAVKHGRDGREGKVGPEGPKGSKGDPGMPGRDR